MIQGVRCLDAIHVGHARGKFGTVLVLNVIVASATSVQGSAQIVIQRTLQRRLVRSPTLRGLGKHSGSMQIESLSTCRAIVPSCRADLKDRVSVGGR